MSTRKNIYYVQYFNPAALPPLEHSALMFKRTGDHVFLTGIAETEGSGLITIVPELSEDIKLWRARSPGWQQKLHYVVFILCQLWRLARAPRGWIYASDLLACPVVCLVKLFRLGRVIYHEHDSPNDSPEAKKGIDRLLLSLRRRAAVSADLVIIPNLERASIFDQMRTGCHPAQIVWNCPRKEEVRPARKSWTGGVLRLLYHGSIVPERLPLSILEAMTKFPGKISLSIVGYFPIGWQHYDDLLRKKARELGIETIVKIEGAMPRARMLEFAASHDVGLAFMPTKTHDINMKHMTGASNKAFDYLAVGVALLVSNVPDWRTFYADPGYALVCNPADADSVAAAFQCFLDDPKRMRAMGESGRQRIANEWNYENQFEPVVHEMNRFSLS